MGVIISSGNKHWPNGVIPYVIDEVDFPENTFKRQIIDDAIDHWNKNTVVRLVPRQHEKDHVIFREAASRCRSPIGRQGGEQSVLCDIGGSDAEDIPDRRSFTSPALTVFNNFLHMVHVEQQVVHVGRVDYSVWHSIYDGRDWNTAVRVPNLVTRQVPAFSTFQNRLHLVYRNEDSDDLFHAQSNSNSWAEPVDIDHQSKVSPALAEYANALHMVYVDRASDQLFHTQFNGRQWGDHTPISEAKSHVSPSLWTFSNQLHMVYSEEGSNQLMHTWYDGSQWRRPQPILSQKSSSAPALTESFGQLHLVHLDIGSNQIWHVILDGVQWQLNGPLAEQASRKTPALAPFLGRVYIAHLKAGSGRFLLAKLDFKDHGRFGRKSIIHEIGHAAGLFHEHVRADRDRFIKLNEQNIPEAIAHNYEQKGDQAEDSGLYDYDSIMHYPPGFPKVVITQQPVTSGFLGSFSNIGKGQVLSDGDLETISALYPSWLAPIPIAGFKSRVAPALAFYRNVIHMVYRNENAVQLMHSQFDGERWSSAIPVSAQVSLQSPALAVFNRQLHLVYSDTRSDAINHSWFDGFQWTEPVRLNNHRGVSTPALAAADGQLHMVCQQKVTAGRPSPNDYRLWHAQFDGQQWTSPAVINRQGSEVSPSLAMYKNRLHLVYVSGGRKRLMHSVLTGDGWQSPQQIQNHSNQASVAIAVYEDRLHMVHASETSDKVRHTYFDGRWRPSVYTYRLKTSKKPALSAFQNRLHMVYWDHSNQLFHTAHADNIQLLGNGKAPSPPVWLDAVLSTVL